MRQTADSSKNFSMPPAAYMAYNLSVVWIFCTFGSNLQPSSAETTQSIGFVPVWMLYSIVQIAALAAFIIAGKRANQLAENGIFALLAAVLMISGAFLMRDGQHIISALGCILAGLGGVCLMLPWSDSSARLSTHGFEQMMLGSTGIAVAMMFAMSFVSDDARYICAQAFPLISAVLAMVALKHPYAVDAAETDASHQEPVPMAGHFEPKTLLASIIAIALPAALNFILFFFVAGRMPDGGTSRPDFLAAGAFLLALVVLLAFLRFTPSVGLTFMYRWEATFLALTAAIPIFWGYNDIGYLTVNALMVVTSQFAWAFFGKVNRTSNMGYVRAFMGGLLLVQCGITVGSCAAFAFEKTSLSMQPNSAVAVVVLIAIVAGFILMPAEQQPEKTESKSASSTDDETLASEMAQRYALSARETDVFRMLVKGRSAPYIRDQLYISQNTVNTHIKHIYAKTGTHTRQEVIDLFEAEKDR